MDRAVWSRMHGANLASEQGVLAVDFRRVVSHGWSIWKPASRSTPAQASSGECCAQLVATPRTLHTTAVVHVGFDLVAALGLEKAATSAKLPQVALLAACVVPRSQRRRILDAFSPRKGAKSQGVAVGRVAQQPVIGAEVRRDSMTTATICPSSFA